MIVINKIYREVLAALLQWANLRCSLSGIEPANGSVNISNRFSSEVAQELSNKYLFCKTTTYHQLNWGVP